MFKDNQESWELSLTGNDIVILRSKESIKDVPWLSCRLYVLLLCMSEERASHHAAKKHEDIGIAKFCLLQHCSYTNHLKHTQGKLENTCSLLSEGLNSQSEY